MVSRFSGLILLVACPVLAQAQSPVRVNGIAWDSLSNRPLGAALVSIGTRSTVTDSTGRFALDSIALGTHRATLQHDVLDSLGLTEITTSVAVRGVSDTIRLTTPSSRTMWRRVCRGEQPYDSGFVFGVVREAATRRPVAGAAIVASWIELRTTGTTVDQKGWRAETQSIADGSYVLCGVPLGTGMQLQSTKDSSAYAGIEVTLTDRSAVRRHDLTLISLADSTAYGTIRGTVTSEGQPISNVRIETDGMPEVRTGTDGGFILRGVRAGTRQVYVAGLGFSPTSRIVEVTAGDTINVSFSVGKATLLDSVRVTAPTARSLLAQGFNERMRRGVGYYRDSTQLGKFLSLEGAFATMPSVMMQRPYGGSLRITIGGDRARGTNILRGGCQALIFIDRMRSDADHLNSLRPSDLGGIEVYRTGEMPADLLTQFGLNPFSKPCAIVAWTKQGWK